MLTRKPPAAARLLGDIANQDTALRRLGPQAILRGLLLAPTVGAALATATIVWAAHFALPYGVQAAFCTVAPAGRSAAGLRVASPALTAIAVVTLFVLARCACARRGGSDRWSAAHAENARFLRQVSIAGAALALLAMVWATVPLLLPARGPAAS